MLKLRDFHILLKLLLILIPSYDENEPESLVDSLLNILESLLMESIEDNVNLCINIYIYILGGCGRTKRHGNRN